MKSIGVIDTKFMGIHPLKETSQVKWSINEKRKRFTLFHCSIEKILHNRNETLWNGKFPQFVENWKPRLGCPGQDSVTIKKQVFESIKWITIFMCFYVFIFVILFVLLFFQEKTKKKLRNTGKFRHQITDIISFHFVSFPKWKRKRHWQFKNPNHQIKKTKYKSHNFIEIPIIHKRIRFYIISKIII